jgi:thioredoxin-related protein
MTALSFLRMICLSVAVLAAAPALAATRFEPPVAGLPGYSFRYNAASDPSADLETALAAAAQKHRRVLVMVGGDWCVWCFLLDRQLDRDRNMAADFYGGFEVLRVYYNDDNKNEYNNEYNNDNQIVLALAPGKEENSREDAPNIINIIQ